MEKKVFTIGTGVFGEGRPKICVPIVGRSREEILKKAEEIAGLPVDLAEWRVDFYEEADKKGDVIRVLQEIKERILGKALLFTFRTKGEGGNRAIEREEYYALNEAAACGGADLLDVEVLFSEEERTRKEIERMHRTGVRVIGSSHDFEKTPGTGEMIEKLLKMEEVGADVAKLAVMPVTRMDVVRLLEATVKADERLPIPVVTMSMGEMGVVSRVSGRLTGSAMTFAAAGEGSAPGQISVGEMIRLLGVV